MPAGGELAALLARRAKVSGEDDSNAEAGDDVSSLKLPVPSSGEATEMPLAPESPKPTAAVEQLHVSTPVRSEELKAVFEERNLEAGIPTPAFLINARNNLKKPGTMGTPTRGTMKKSDLPTPEAKSARTTNGASLVSDEASAEDGGILGNRDTIAMNNISARANGEVANRRGRINSSRSCTSSVSSHASTSSDNIGPYLNLAVSSLSGEISESTKNISNNDVTQAKNSDNSAHAQDALASRRGPLNASSKSITSEAINTPTPGNRNKKTGVLANSEKNKASSALMRRQILAAKVRTLRNNPSGGSKTNKKTQQQNDGGDATMSKTAIISPKRDEFEVLFADDDFVSPGDSSMDSIVKEMHNTHESLLNRSYSIAGSTATVPTNNLHPHLMIGGLMDDAVGHNTPEKSRIHNASTPKIRGNAVYKREDYGDQGLRGLGRNAFDDSLPNAHILSRNSDVKSAPHLQSQQSPQRRNGLPMHREDAECELQQKTSSYRTNVHDQLPQSYPFRQSSSQLSQMSAITNPSCFPQENYSMPGSAHRVFTELQQPFLLNETTGAKGSPIGMNAKTATSLGFAGSNERLSAFAPRLEVENQRQREQLNSMTKKLEEKDAIISQLMKRISDLETINANSARGAFEYKVVNTGAFVKSSVESAFPQSSGARDNGGTGDPFVMSPVRENSPSFPQWSNSMDTESACISMPSPRQQQQQQSQEQPSIQKQTSLHSNAHHRRVRSGLSTTATSSTASVTTSSSSKLPRSKSASDSSRQSSKGEQGLGKKKKNNVDRKFVC